MGSRFTPHLLHHILAILGAAVVRTMAPTVLTASQARWSNPTAAAFPNPNPNAVEITLNQPSPVAVTASNRLWTSTSLYARQSPPDCLHGGLSRPRRPSGGASQFKAPGVSTGDEEPFPGRRAYGGPGSHSDGPPVGPR